MKLTCFVDTCSLIYMRDIELAHKPLHRWLWQELNVCYSATIWGEIQNHLHDMGSDATWLSRFGDKYVYPLSTPTVTSVESIMFGHARPIDVPGGVCHCCNRDKTRRQNITSVLTGTRDRGERHNCCTALASVIRGKQPQVIFLTDDEAGVRDYVQSGFVTPFFGVVWSSLDFLLYLFVHHWRRIPYQQIEAALRDINARKSAPSMGPDKAAKSASRLTSYQQRATEIDRLQSAIQGVL